MSSGTSGSQLPVVTNYFKLEMAPDWHLYQYHVDFNPPIDSRKMRMALLMSHENLLGRTKAFDGMILYLPKRLQEKVVNSFVVVVIFMIGQQIYYIYSLKVSLALIFGFE